MSKVIKLKKGLDIKLKGEAENLVKNIERCDFYAVKPTDFRLLTPKLVVKAGDQVSRNRKQRRKKKVTGGCG